MEDSAATQPSLLLRLRDPADRVAWERFVEVYTPFVYGVCRKRGLQAADAADVAQEVMRTVATSIGRFDYDRLRGSFRGWLFSVTRARLIDFHRRRRREAAAAGSGQTTVRELLDAVPADTSADEAEWQRSWQRHVLDHAARRAREEFTASTWSAFWRTAVDGRAVAEVAGELGLSPGAVYIARSRVTARLRQIVEEMDGTADAEQPGTAGQP